jgi:hypothetical protein
MGDPRQQRWRKAMARKVAVTLLCAILTAATFIGCGDDSGLPTRYPVSGTITYNGKALEQGNINFAPNGPGGRPAGGNIINGKYSLTTQDAEDGAVPGEYKVSVVAKTTDTSTVDLKIKGATTVEAKKAISAVFPQKVAAKAAAKAKSLIPAKYGSPETSGLKFQVKPQSNSGVDFDLKD